MPESNLFPLHFNPMDWRGPRARQFPDRSDAFQQLSGDILREQFGSRANVSPTEGRDGSIDAFISADASSLPAFLGLPAPQIIECKDHDDKRGEYLANIMAGWTAVEEKLRKQAAGGWSGLFQPWRLAKSYVYCVSAVVPNQVARDKLQGRIKSFFASLPTEQRPPLEEIRVLDWADLRDLCDRHPRVLDRWLGTGLPLLLGHAEYCATLNRFRRHLLQTHLPFVEPAATEKSHPKNVLSRLDALAGVGGVLLNGVGGAGKTRYTLEVANLAEAQGWRVIHVLPGEPGVTTNELSAAIFNGRMPTLIVFDYLDQMTSLDLGGLRHRLLPEAERRGIRLALLANMRPSSLRRPNPERDALFTEDIQLQISPHQNFSITELALDRVAPAAVLLLGRARVRELCGERPIIALLVAEELQKRALTGTLTTQFLGGLRNGDLLSWLRRRLAEDKLIVAAGDGFLPPAPEPALIVAASILAATPLPMEEMARLEFSHRTAANTNGPQIETQVLAGLLSLGWIEERGTAYFAAHDVVADEVFSQVLWDRASNRLREGMMELVLAPALKRPRLLGRYATAFNRLLATGAPETASEATMREHAAIWLQQQAKGLGVTLISSDSDEVAYALGAIVSAPVWASICIAEWGNLISPWLSAHGNRHEARHLLYRGLKEIPAGDAPELSTVALSWLPLHLNDISATYVLDPLLSRSDLSDVEATRAIDLAHNWLELFIDATEAQFVLPALLIRPDLRTEASARTVNFSLAWLETHQGIPSASFVLTPLLQRADAAATYAGRAIQLTLKWLEKFSEKTDAHFVLTQLLARSDLGEGEIKRTKIGAFAWLGRHSRHKEARSIYRALLIRPDLIVAEAQRATELALAWAQEHRKYSDFSFVLPPILDRTDLPAETIKRAANISMSWLEEFPDAPDTDFLLRRLLGLSGLSQEFHSRCVALALPHLKRLGNQEQASFLLKSCLRDRELTAGPAEQVVEIGLAWLRSNPLVEGADFIFNRLLSRPALTSENWNEVACLALAWLRGHSAKENRDLGLAALLIRHQQLAESDLEWVLQEARSYIASPPPGAHSPDKLKSALIRFEKNTTQGVRQKEKDVRRREGASENLIKRLDRAVRGQASAPSSQELEQAMAEARVEIARADSWKAGDFISRLLILAHQGENSELRDKILALTREVLSHPNFLPQTRTKMCTELWFFISRGAWPKAQAKPVLKSLNLLDFKGSMKWM